MMAGFPIRSGMTGGALFLQQRVLICPLLGAQELDSDEPSLCVHQPGKTVNKKCPWLRCRLSRIVRAG